MSIAGNGELGPRLVALAVVGGAATLPFWLPQFIGAYAAYQRLTQGTSNPSTAPGEPILPQTQLLIPPVMDYKPINGFPIEVIREPLLRELPADTQSRIILWPGFLPLPELNQADGLPIVVPGPLIDDPNLVRSILTMAYSEEEKLKALIDDKITKAFGMSLHNAAEFGTRDVKTIPGTTIIHPDPTKLLTHLRTFPLENGLHVVPHIVPENQGKNSIIELRKVDPAVAARYAVASTELVRNLALEITKEAKAQKLILGNNPTFRVLGSSAEGKTLLNVSDIDVTVEMTGLSIADYTRASVLLDQIMRLDKGKYIAMVNNAYLKVNGIAKETPGANLMFFLKSTNHKVMMVFIESLLKFHGF